MGRSSEYDPTAAYDEDGFLQLVAAICVRNQTDMVLMISNKSGQKWKLPGGACSWNETLESAALRELYEEAGVTGEIHRFVGTFENPEKMRRTFVYVIKYLAHEPRWEENSLFERQRSWVQVNVARKWLLVNYSEQVVYLDRFLLKHGRTLVAS